MRPENAIARRRPEKREIDIMVQDGLSDKTEYFADIFTNWVYEGNLQRTADGRSIVDPTSTVISRGHLPTPKQHEWLRGR